MPIHSAFDVNITNTLQKVMVFNAIFNNISAGRGNQTIRRKPLTHHKSLTNLIT